jgi:hypothetical protein
MFRITNPGFKYTIQAEFVFMFVGIDGHNRPTYKNRHGEFYCSTHKLFDFETPKEIVASNITIEDLSFKGMTFDAEPSGADIKDEVRKKAIILH